MTRSLSRIAFLFTMVAALSFVGAGCAGKKKAGEDNGSSNEIAADANTLGDSDTGNAVGIQTVYFPYDSFSLDATAKSVLKANAQILKDKASMKVQVEGHCDQRGGIQYNIALGEKRANAIRAYLMDQGVSGDRISTISYGKERLLADAMTDAAMAKNRRGNFAITSR